MLEWAYTNISSITNVEYTYYYSLMDIKKQKKVTTYKYDKDKKRTLAGEMLARRMISTYCNVVPEEISFETGCYGKHNAKHLNVEFNTNLAEAVSNE